MEAIAKEPQRLTLQELAANGPGDNPHVIVTDYLCGRGYVFEMMVRKGSPPPTPDQGGPGKAWIPLFPKSQGDAPEPNSFVVLLETAPTQASGTGFHLLSRRAEMEGLVFPISFRTLKGEVQARLSKSYPGTDFSKGLLLEEWDQHHKKDAPFFAYALAILAGGGLLLGLPLLSLGIVFARGRARSLRAQRRQAEDNDGAIHSGSRPRRR
jgi:hypothetical protein